MVSPEIHDAVDIHGRDRIGSKCVIGVVDEVLYEFDLTNNLDGC
jgi:hypothetical protein